MWLASEAPSVVLMSPAPKEFAGVRMDRISRGRATLVDIRDGTNRHLVMRSDDGRDRLLVRDAGPDDDLACTLIADGSLEMRAAAATSLLSSRRGARAKVSGRGRPRPSRFQVHRLSLLLRVADELAAVDAGEVSMRDIAMKTAYPWLIPGRSIEWKGSAERRQTQRLVSEARGLVEGGYRNLLRGSLISRPITSK